MNVLNILLLGIDSLIACVAIGPMVAARWRVPLAALFGVADAGGFLLGVYLHWQVSDAVATVVPSVFMIVLGVYWLVVVAATADIAARWPVFVLPFALTLDNLTYGLVGDDSRITQSNIGEAGWQALASGGLALVGLLVAVVLPRFVPQLRQRKTATLVAGAALVVAAGLELLAG